MKIAWITGGGSGIGRAIAFRLVEDGWTVAVTARTAADLDTMVASPEAEGRIHAYPCDVTDRAGIARVVAQVEAAHGPIELAVLAAGIYLFFGLDDFSAEMMETLVRVNVGGVANVIEAVMPRFRSRNAGRLAVVTSAAQYRGFCRTAGYGASKAALLTMSETLALQTRGSGIAVQVIVPAYVQTRMTETAPFPLPGIISAEEAAEQAVAGMKTDAFEILVPRELVEQVREARKLSSEEYFAMASITPLFGGVPQ